jgi:uncharacterized protein YvpB
MALHKPSIPKDVFLQLGFVLVLCLLFAIIIYPVASKAIPFIHQQASQTPTAASESPVIAATSTPAINTPYPTLTPYATPSPTPPKIPESSYIINITGHRQAYHLSCESSVSVDWANYFGVTIYESTFQASLPHSDNPDFGFVGDVNSVWGQTPPYAYGVYAGPVAASLQQYGLPAKAVKGYTLEEIKQNLVELKPVIVWVIANMESSTPVKYIDSKGRSTIVAPYEHVVIVTGYGQDSIRYMTNGKFYDIPTNVFLNSWGVLGNMAVIHE